MTIINYNPIYRTAFEEMLVTYFTELNSDIPEPIIRGKLMDLIRDQVEKDIIHVALLLDDGVPAGFSIYQIDSSDSDWRKRPGWGFIREFFIAEHARRKGFGKALAAYCDEQMQQLGATDLYLTSDDAVEFWKKCGYQLTDEVASNKLPVLEKHF